MMKTVFSITCIILIALSFWGCQDKESLAELNELKAQTELEEQNQALIEKYIEAWNAYDIQLLDELLDPQFQIYIPSNSENPMSLEQYKEWIGGIFQAYPDIQYEINELFATGDKVCLRWTCTASFKVENAEGEAVEKKGVVSAIEIYRVQNGKIIEEKSEMDALGWNQQLGYTLVKAEAE